jgi:hypothetical protein
MMKKLSGLTLLVIYFGACNTSNPNRESYEVSMISTNLVSTTSKYKNGKLRSHCLLNGDKICLACLSYDTSGSLLSIAVDSSTADLILVNR